MLIEGTITTCETDKSGASISYAAKDGTNYNFSVSPDELLNPGVLATGKPIRVLLKDNTVRGVIVDGAPVLHEGVRRSQLQNDKGLEPVIELLPSECATRPAHPARFLRQLIGHYKT